MPQLVMGCRFHNLYNMIHILKNKIVNNELFSYFSFDKTYILLGDEKNVNLFITPTKYSALFLHLMIKTPLRQKKHM